MHGKRLTALAILEVLRRHSDVEHRLRQAEIIDWMQRDYEITATRKTVRENLSSLQEAGYPVACNGGWYYEHEFCPAELDLLVQGLLFNSYIQSSQREELIRKLRALNSEHYAPRTFEVSRPANPQFLYTLEVIRGAIERAHKIECIYVDLDVDKCLHPRLNDRGEPRVYRINPYQIALANGRYYLICNVDKYDNVAHFRIDRIAECREMEEDVKPMRAVQGLEDGLQVPEYMEGHVYMLPGKPELVRIRAKRSMAGDILDRFGMDVQFERVTQDTLEAVFYSERESVKRWLGQYAQMAERIE